MMNSGPGNEGISGSVRGRQGQRHTPEQRQHLEKAFNHNPYPTKEVQLTLCQELHLDLKQVKFWFQNRRSRRKNGNERANYDALNQLVEQQQKVIEELRTEIVRLNQEKERQVLALTGSSSNALQGVSPYWPITTEKRSIVINLARRMTKSFWKNLNAAFPVLPYTQHDDVTYSVRPNDEPGVPSHFVLSAFSSLVMDVSRATLLEFFDNHRIRLQWDLYTADSFTKVIEDIYPGPHPEDRVSIYQALRDENSMFILQDITNTPAGSAVVYVPIHPEWVRSVWSGVNLNYNPLLPVGFMISAGANSEESAVGSSSSSVPRMPGRSLLSMLYELFPGPSSDQGAIEAIASIKNVVGSTLQRIRVALSD